MVLGCTSGAGKSWLATALCRWYANQGYKVAPFKAQNMSNNARVVGGVAGNTCGHAGGEIGAAQYFQALAARAVPEVRMNPLLLKPEADTHSQVVLLGQVDHALTAMPWRGRSQQVWPVLAQALDDLRADNDIVIIEGAGSPAEINLANSDVVNMRVARHCNAACLLVADIDRGGAFAHLYGTWALLPHESDRQLIHGFVLNKFRGDAALLPPAPQMLQARTGVPVLATLPMWRGHGLPEEDGVFDDAATSSTQAGAITVAIVAYPRISNLDEFQPLKTAPGVRLRWVRDAAQLRGLQQQDWIILPGSKATAADLHWLRTQGLDAAICQHAAQGGRVLGICGGLQMLGEALIDVEGVETTNPALANAPGLGLLPLVTALGADKTVRHTTSRFATALPGAWATLAGCAVQGYEIHLGQTAPHPAMLRAGHVAQAVLADAQGTPLGWINGAATAPNPHAGNVLGLYLHGVFEDAAVLQALFGHTAPTLEATFDRMAAFVQTHMGAEVLHALIRPAQGG